MAKKARVGAIRSVNVTYCLVMESAEEFGAVYQALQRRKDRHHAGPVRDRLICLLDKMDVEFGKYQEEVSDEAL